MTQTETMNPTCEVLNFWKESILKNGVNKNGISELFNDNEKSTNYLETLWLLRALIMKNGIPHQDDPMYKIFELTNDLIGAIIKV